MLVVGPVDANAVVVVEPQKRSTVVDAIGAGFGVEKQIDFAAQDAELPPIDPGLHIVREHIIWQRKKSILYNVE